jgi:Lrp/AsnC family transcriptional regulator of ectoine degradation
MKSAALDAADIRILIALQEHGPLSKSQLAELVRLSPTPCWARLTRLKKAGLIRGYHADVALDKIVEVCRVVVTIALESHRKADFDRFEAFIRNRDEIVDCVATGGGMDYVMTVYTTDLAAFQSLMDELLAAELGIQRYMTYIATRAVKSAQPNLQALLGKRGG